MDWPFLYKILSLYLTEMKLDSNAKTVCKVHMFQSFETYEHMLHFSQSSCALLAQLIVI